MNEKDLPCYGCKEDEEPCLICKYLEECEL